ncbi:hypothetical protein ACFV46_12660 [Streptomyces sp. NPDC059852]|uniref:hypothetical protein n=1 Tax=Streptomyces sp. NPDC059852 TaxID=3346972 RepID=UPI00364F198C
MALTSSSAQHPDRSLPDEVELAYDLLERRRLVEVSNADEMARRASRTEKERRKIASVREQVLREAGVSEGTLSDYQAILQGIDTRMSPEQWTHGLKPLPEGPATITPELDGSSAAQEMERVAYNEFWWNKSNWWWENVMRTWNAAGKLWFAGWITCPDGNLHNYHWGVNALYELHQNRLLPSADGWYKSSPFADMQGKFEARAGNDFLSGDNWCKCWVHLKHSVFQAQFGGVKYLGGGLQDNTQNLVNIVDDGQVREVPMNRRFFFPRITISKSEINSSYSLWAFVEIAFDLQLEGRGSHLLLDWQGGPVGLGMVVPQWFISTGLYS